MDLIYNQSKVYEHNPAMKTKQGIVMRGKAFRHSLLRDRAIGHQAAAGTVEIGAGGAKADDTAGECASYHVSAVRVL